MSRLRATSFIMDLKIEQGKKLELRIEDYGVNGEGIAKTNGFVIFINYALLGERVLARIDHVKKDFAYATLLQVLEPSEFRVQVPCNRFTRCGGCDILALDYQKQLELKKRSLVNTFSKNYGQNVDIQDVVPSPNLEYRNKLTIPFGMVNGKVAVGFYKEGTHKIVSITKCFLSGKWVEKLIAITLDYANSNNITVYDEQTQKGVLRHLYARKVDDFYSITLVVTQRPDNLDSFIQSVGKEFDNCAVYLNYNTQPNNVVLGKKSELVGGREVDVTVRGVKVSIDPNSFLQVNDYIRDKIYDKVEDLIKVGAGSVVIDAYSGVGLLGASFAKRGAKVYNLEIVPEATADGKKLADKNGLSLYVQNICCDSAKELPKLVESLKDKTKCAIHSMKLQNEYFDKIKNGVKTIELRLNDKKRQLIKKGDSICFTSQRGEQIVCRVDELYNYPTFRELFDHVPLSACGFSDITKDAAAKSMREFYSKEDESTFGALGIKITPVDVSVNVILDPPRKGCDKAVLDALKTIDVNGLIYISCNPATLTRDLKYLSDVYTPTLVIPYDMFPNTRHIETVCLLTKK